jgi:hypothetical protein
MNVECPHCRMTLQVPESRAGQRAKCGGCGHKFTVPLLNEKEDFDQEEEPALQPENTADIEARRLKQIQRGAAHRQRIRRFGSLALKGTGTVAGIVWTILKGIVALVIVALILAGLGALFTYVPLPWSILWLIPTVLLCFIIERLSAIVTLLEAKAAETMQEPT